MKTGNLKVLTLKNTAAKDDNALPRRLHMAYGVQNSYSLKVSILKLIHLHFRNVAFND